MEAESRDEVEKTLYALAYQYGRNPEAPHKLTFFYAADAAEARQKADEKLRKFRGPTREISLKPYPGGFSLPGVNMQGKLTFHEDGTLKT